MDRLAGKTALVTGGARGMGEAIVRMFVAEGATVVVADLLGDLAGDVAKSLGGQAVSYRLDVTKAAEWPTAVDTAVQTFGKLDILVNDAGIGIPGAIETQPLDDYLATIMVNQVGCWLGMKSVIPAMREAGGGSIVNISSTAGFVGVPGLSAYSASKFAIRGMTLTAAVELGPDRIRVNSVHPGTVETPMIAHVPPALKQKMCGRQPIARVARPAEVATLVTFLASDEASYCTGSEFRVDGGALAGEPAFDLETVQQAASSSAG